MSLDLKLFRWKRVGPLRHSYYSVPQGGGCDQKTRPSNRRESNPIAALRGGNRAFERVRERVRSMVVYRPCGATLFPAPFEEVEGKKLPRSPLRNYRFLSCEEAQLPALKPDSRAYQVQTSGTRERVSPKQSTERPPVRYLHHQSKKSLVRLRWGGRCVLLAVPMLSFPPLCASGTA